MASVFFSLEKESACSDMRVKGSGGNYMRIHSHSFAAERESVLEVEGTANVCI